MAAFGFPQKRKFYRKLSMEEQDSEHTVLYLGRWRSKQNETPGRKSEGIIKTSSEVHALTKN